MTISDLESLYRFRNQMSTINKFYKLSDKTSQYIEQANMMKEHEIK